MNFNILSWTFNTRLFVNLCLGFILFTIIGTLSHEAGHYTVARMLGYDATVNYAHCKHVDTENKAFADSTLNTYFLEMASGKDFPGQERYYAIMQKRRNDAPFITVGGPIQTMLTGTIGFLLIRRYRRRMRSDKELKLKHWIIIFVALFWLRQVFNAASVIGYYAFKGKISGRNDESRLESYYHLPQLSILLSTAIIGALIVAYITFRIVPKQQRVTFLASGLVGGALGFYLWMYLIGPLIMP